MTRGTPKGPKPSQPPPGAVLPPPPGPVEDPLAALRDTPGGDDLPPLLGDETPEAEPEPEFTPTGLVTQDAWDEARRRAVVAMHADTTTLGFLHKGGSCGCHYIAGVILHAVMPVALDVEPDALQEACDRFHPGEPCSPGQNHPGQAEAI